MTFFKSTVAWSWTYDQLTKKTLFLFYHDIIDQFLSNHKMNAIMGLRRSAFFTLLILAYILKDFVYSQRNEVSSTLVGIVRTNMNTVIFQPCLAPMVCFQPHAFICWCCNINRNRKTLELVISSIEVKS